MVGKNLLFLFSFSFPFHGHPAGLNTKPATRAEELLVSQQPSISGATASTDILLQLLTFTRRLMAVFALWPPQNTVVCVVVVLRCRPPDESPQVNLRHPFGGVSGMSYP